MKQVIGYRCEHCGKIYLRWHACKEHEENLCPRNPLKMPFCYSCQHYDPAGIKDRETVYYKFDTWDDCEQYEKTIDINRCNHPEKKCKLFNNIKISGELYEGLREADYEEMPTNSTGGCKFYKPYETHPHLEILKKGERP